MDAQLDSTGDLALGLPRLRDRLEAVAQRVRLRVLGHRGDWSFNLEAGLPYQAWASQKPPRVNEIGALLRREILAVPGVAKIEGWTGTWEHDARAVSFAGRVFTTAGVLDLEFAALGREGGNLSASLYLLPAAVPIV